MTTDTIETWTARAVAALRRGRDAHRDAILECGRCCYEALRLAVASGRYSYGLRSDLARQLSEAAGQKVDVSRYVVCDRIATLLGEGVPLGSLGITAIRAFYPLLRRLPAEPAPGSLARDRGRKAKGEEYEVVPDYRQSGRQLFAQATREGWGYEDVRDAVELLTLGSRRRKDLFPDGMTAADCPFIFAELAAPKDLADAIAAMVRRSRDPALVSVLLEKYLRQPTGATA